MFQGMNIPLEIRVCCVCRFRARTHFLGCTCNNVSYCSLACRDWHWNWKHCFECNASNGPSTNALTLFVNKLWNYEPDIVVLIQSFMHLQPKTPPEHRRVQFLCTLFPDDKTLDMLHRSWTEYNWMNFIVEQGQPYRGVMGLTGVTRLPAAYNDDVVKAIAALENKEPISSVKTHIRQIQYKMGNPQYITRRIQHTVTTEITTAHTKDDLVQPSESRRPTW